MWDLFHDVFIFISKKKKKNNNNKNNVHFLRIYLNMLSYVNKSQCVYVKYM